MGAYNLLIILRSAIFRVFIVLLFSNALAQVAFAQTTTSDAATMMANFAATVPKLMQMVTAIAYVLGMYLIFKGVMGLKTFGEQRTQMSLHTELKGPLILLFVGAALLYLPSSVQVGMTTFWSNPYPYGYLAASQDQWTSVYQDAFLIIQFIGTIAFIRGLLLLTQLGQQAQPGTFGKAMAHIIGGIMCINLYDFLTAVNTTLGIVVQQ